MYTEGEYKQGVISPQNLIQMQKAHYDFLESPKQYFSETYMREMKNT